MIAYILCGIIVAQEILHRIERRDLYNRIMSNSLREYKQKETAPVAPTSAHRRVLNKWRDKGVEMK